MWMKYVKLESFQNLALAEMIESYLNEQGIPAQLKTTRRADGAQMTHHNSDLLVPFHEADDARSIVYGLMTTEKGPIRVTCKQCFGPKQSIISLCTNCGVDGFFSRGPVAVN
jgi:hypothetical protein